MAAPQVLKPGHPDQLVIAAAAALLLAAAAVWHGTLSATHTAPSTSSETAGAATSFEAVRAVVHRAAEREATRRESRLAPASDPAVVRAAATASGVLEPAGAPPPRASAAADAGAVAFPRPFSPTLFDGVAAAGNDAVSPGRASLASVVHSTATPELVAGDRVVATVSFYYCTEDAGPVGDGGAWCGIMRDGTTVYPGAAACDYHYLGQQFRIEGDPTGRVYTCNDTGSAVHGLHRDIWFRTNAEGWSWQRDVGRRVVIEIVN